MKDRIKQILIREGLTSGGFADEIGVQRSSISHILNGRNNPSLDFVIKVITRFPALNVDWLLRGTGEMYKSADTDVNQLNLSTPTIFTNMMGESPADEDTDSLQQPDNQSEQVIGGSKQVDQIVIFYSDSSFDVYRPRKKE